MRAKFILAGAAAAVFFLSTRSCAGSEYKIGAA